MRARLSPGRPWLVGVALSAMAVGCGSLLGIDVDRFVEAGATGADGGEGDAGSRTKDAAGDGRPRSDARSDARDGAALDARRDGPRADAVVDGPTADVAADAPGAADGAWPRPDANSVEAGGDARARDARSDAPLCSGLAVTFSATAIADTWLDNEGNANPSIRYGAGPNANVGQNGSSVALFQFPIAVLQAESALAAGTAIDVHLVVTRFQQSGSYLAVTPGTLLVYPMGSAWNEGNGTAYDGAAWVPMNQTSQTGAVVLWGTAGASGAADRGQLPLASMAVPSAAAVLASFGAPAPITVPLTMNLSTVAPWISNHQLTLQLAPSGGLLMYLNQREVSDALAASLSVTYCP